MMSVSTMRRPPDPAGSDAPGVLASDTLAIFGANVLTTSMHLGTSVALTIP